MKKIRLEISGITYSQTQSGSYVLTLAEVSGKRKLPIVIGGFEAQAIAIELEKMTPTRPLTHDLFKSFAQSFSIQVKEVVIYNLNEGIFYAKLICEKEGVLTEIDARTSDAIAIGIRFNATIYTFESILSSAGVLLDENEFETPTIDETIETTDTSTNSFLNLSLEELNEQLNEAFENEEYEIASKIRDEIKNRSSK